MRHSHGTRPRTREVGDGAERGDASGLAVLTGNDFWALSAATTATGGWIRDRGRGGASLHRTWPCHLIG